MYLFDLCEEYDLRWVVIHDRYEYKRPLSEIKSSQDEKTENGDTKIEEKKENEESETENPSTSPEEQIEPTESTKPIPAQPNTRTIEDLKARFYDVGRRIMKSRQNKSEHVGQAEDELYRQMKYSKESEVKRKDHLERLLARSPAEIAEEEALVLESRKLEAAAEMMLLERAEILKILDAPPSTQKITEFQSSQGLAQLTGQLFNADKNKKRKDQPNPATAEAIQQHNQNLHYLQQQHQQLQAQQAQKLQQLQTQPVIQTLDDAKAMEKKNSKSIKTESGETTPGTPTSSGNKISKKGVVNPKKEKEQVKKTQLTGSSAIAAAIHRKLSSKEEAVYGLSYHDKLSTGVYLRSSKITAYKQTLQGKINQVLAELGIPPRPVIPTAKVTAKFDSLQQSISVLLDAKKQADKLEMELNVIRAQKGMSPNNNENNNA